ncbi:MAG: IS4 family transposase, partial [Bacteroidota bacterium]
MVKLTLFSQITSLIPRQLFADIVKKYEGDKYSKGIDSWTQLISMIFCHLGQLSSVRDISNGLRSITGNIVHLGCSQAPSKSSISYINRYRTSKIYEEFYYALVEHLKKQVKFTKPALHQLRRKVYLLDASVISLSLSLYDWAKFRTRKGAVKLHLLLDYQGCLPAFADLTRGNVADITVARNMPLPSDSILVFDMGYYDFSWWNKLDSMNSWFVTRSKDNLDYQIVEDFDVSEEKDKNVLEDSNIRLTGIKGKADYPKLLRRVRYWDEVNKNELIFITNNRYWTATTVANIYKERWHIESFFKLIKQNLKIKSFVGTSENAVQIQ